jgi:uncharacterized heparinase superfamily protein
MQRRLDAPADWDQPDVPLLWRYHLHYFDDLVAEGAASRSALHVKLVQRWIDENAPVAGTGWDPYPVSRRIVNWIKWALAGNTIREQWNENLALQAAHLANNIEWHILGNHLFANAKALVFAGLYFEGEDADKWLGKGLAILDREVAEQVLEDGGHFERSTMYHVLILEDLLDLINLTRGIRGRIDESVIDVWEQAATVMLNWLAMMEHPDGEISFFNDAALGVALSPPQLRDYASALDIAVKEPSGRSVHLESSGFARADAGQAVLIADIGSVGPDYLPGHAHAGTLSFELSLFGERWFVNSGVSTYEPGPERQRQRGTAAHNTVIVDDQDSSEVWGGFRVARRAHVSDVAFDETGESISIRASHGGYKRLPGNVVHTRTLKLGANSLEIADHLAGEFQSARASLLVHPDVQVELQDDVVVMSRDGQAAELECSGGGVVLEDAEWHSEFGVSNATHKITIELTGPELQTRVMWKS